MASQNASVHRNCFHEKKIIYIDFALFINFWCLLTANNKICILMWIFYRKSGLWNDLYQMTYTTSTKPLGIYVLGSVENTVRKFTDFYNLAFASNALK